MHTETSVKRSPMGRMEIIPEQNQIHLLTISLELLFNGNFKVDCFLSCILFPYFERNFANLVITYLPLDSEAVSHGHSSVLF